MTGTTQSASTLPIAGSWGCESKTGVQVSKYVSTIASNANGAIQVVVTNINSTVNGKAIILNPWADAGRTTPITAGSAIAAWDCGPDTTKNGGVDISKYLPGSYRQPTTASGFATATGSPHSAALRQGLLRGLLIIFSVMGYPVRDHRSRWLCPFGAESGLATRIRPPVVLDEDSKATFWLGRQEN